MDQASRPIPSIKIIFDDAVITAENPSVEDMWRAHQREIYNSTGGKQGAWLRGRDAVKVPPLFIKNLRRISPYKYI